ncbi:hypothetical protein TI39_contig297g00023 [Zymoseptoria brevis]|uniref:Large ribosomal subunit protein uL23m n=1 Tax=Zymoseptoria brevis TaxID=1047168 RepID=A0A0F4GV76_9PEZI|nr:hypothetical protein TI39_contig297g00023 [Zymoseptoria brevis]
MALPSFKVGLKELYLPDIRVTLLRSKHGPNHAHFRVPLFFSKLDLRDYLWHVYKVEIFSVQSYVKQQRVRSGRESDRRPAPRRWHRPKAHKHMTVQLAKPFVWPEEPKDFSDWNMETVEAAEKEQDKQQDLSGSTGDAIENKERRERMREQAKALLSGKTKWRPSSSKSI